MEIEQIPLDKLHPHPRNSNVMPEELLRKLAAHLERTDRYPPVIVRRLAGDAEVGRYQILDGHHRVAALRRIGRGAARCVVWDVDDEEALLLLATLNRLQGTDDPRKRGALLGDIAAGLDVPAMCAALPDSRERLERLLALARQAAPVPRPPTVAADLPVAVHFFLLPTQKRALEARLAAIGGAREAALMAMVDARPGESNPGPAGR